VLMIREQMGVFEFQKESVIVGVRSEAPGGEGDDLLAAVDRFSLRPLSRDEIATFTMDLCNNKVDTHHSVFPVDELKKVNRLVVGKPFMERHDVQGSLPRGTFFRSRLHEEPDRGYVAVRPDVYILRTVSNEDLIRNIEGGVYRATSIGFSFRFPECSICHEDIRACSHVPGRTYGDSPCHYVMHDVVEVREGSLVYSGSQGTSIVGIRENGLKSLPEALRAAREEYHRPLELVSRKGAAERSLWMFESEE